MSGEASDTLVIDSASYEARRHSGRCGKCINHRPRKDIVSLYPAAATSSTGVMSVFVRGRQDLFYFFSCIYLFIYC